jgi:hypothetical protein
MKSQRRLPLATLFLTVVVALFLSVSPGLALDAPHDENASPAITCATCHALHGGGIFNALVTRGAEQETQCKTCHNPSGQASTMTAVANHVVTHDGAETIIDCGACHNVHKTMSSTRNSVTADNLSHIRRNVKKYWGDHALTDLVYQSTPGDYAFTSAPYNGACQTCHTETQHQQNDGTAPDGQSHHDGEDCLSCHVHEDGFAPSGCTACHQDAQPTSSPTRRAVTDEFSYVGGTTHLSGATIDEEDCEVCHNQTAHKEGDVVLKKYETTNTVTLTGDPNVTSSEATKLEDVCLSCHTDAANLTDTTPFSTTGTPADIDSLWTSSSSHNSDTAPVVTCYGEGTFGCHQSGHGSKNDAILAAFDTLYTKTISEDLCLVCHDSDGPANSDIAADYPTTVTWVATGQGVGGNTRENVNDRHDIEDAVQTTSGYEMECFHCHDPHAATPTNKLRDDPDPDDSHDPQSSTVGTDGRYFADSTTMTEWCLSCHDGDLPAGIVQPTATTDRMIDIESTLAGDAHGEADGNAVLKDDTDDPPGNYGYGDNVFLQCLDCHAVHGTRSNGNLFQLKDLVKGTGTTWSDTSIPSDRASPDELVYEVTDNSVKTAEINGYQWCNTCHTGSMGDKKDNCFDCHYHGTRW